MTTLNFKILVIGLSILVAIPDFAQADPCGTVLMIRGLVEVIHAHPRAIRKANNGDPIECGDKIVTKSKNGTATLEFSRGKMIVGPKTRIEIADAETPDKAKEKQKQVNALNLIYGISRVLISKKMHEDSPRFEVRTPAATVGVRGTDFVVGHDAQAHVTREATIQGIVEVSRHDSTETVDVAAGQEITVSDRPENSGQVLTPQPMAETTKDEIRSISRIADYDPDFVHRGAIETLGKPEDWDKKKEDIRRQSWNGSEFQHQTAASQIELTPMLSLASLKYGHNANTSNSVSDFLMNVAVSGEYGINPMFSAGLRLAYAMDFYSGSGKANGLTDPMIFMNGRSHVGPGLIRYGGSLSLSPSAHSVSYTNTSSTANEFTGGITFANYAGYEMLMGPGTLGGRLSFDVLQTDRKFNSSFNGNSQSITVRGGQSIGLVGFWEWPVKEWILGGDAGFQYYSGVSQSVNTSYSNQLNNSSQFFPKLEGYGFCKVSDRLTATLKAGFGPGDAFVSNVFASGSGVYVTAGGRFAL